MRYALWQIITALVLILYACIVLIMVDICFCRVIIATIRPDYLDKTGIVTGTELSKASYIGNQKLMPRVDGC